MKAPKHIAVNTRFLLSGGLEGMGRFSHEILRRLVQAHPEVQFSFFFDRKYDQKFIYGKNVTPYVLFPQARHPILFQIWFDWAVARKLKQLKPDLFFSPDGFLSLKTEVPQVPVFHDLAFMHFPEHNKKVEADYYHKFFPRFAKKASRILAVSEFTRQDVVKQFGVSENKVEVIHNACETEYPVLTETEKSEVELRFSGGKPYILFVGAIHPRKNLERLILAFNKFKSNTKSDWKLLLVGRKAWKSEKVLNTFQNSEHQADIHFSGFVSDEDLKRIYSAAQVLAYIPIFEGFGIPILEGFQARIPVISSSVSSMPEVAGDAALLVDPYDVEAIADGLRRIHDEPELRETLIHKGSTRKSMFSWDASAAKTWDAFLKVLN